MKQTVIKKVAYSVAAVATLCLVPVTTAAGCVVPSMTKFSQRAIVTPEPNLTTDPQVQEQSADMSRAHSIVGLWKVTFYSTDNQVVDVAFDAWQSDGTEILNDFTDPIEDNVCLGVWAPAGGRTIKLKHPSWTFDTGGNLTGTAIIRETVSLDADADTFNGSLHIDYFDTSNNPIGSVDGRVKGTRIKPD